MLCRVKNMLCGGFFPHPSPLYDKERPIFQVQKGKKREKKKKKKSDAVFKQMKKKRGYVRKKNERKNSTRD